MRQQPVGDPALLEALSRATLAALWYYPVKSCAGHSVNEAVVEARGIRHDRELMVVEARTGQFLTQRELPHMALIIPEREGERLELRAPGMRSLSLDLRDEGRLMLTMVWKDYVEGIDQGEEAAAWLGDYLGAAARLVRMPTGAVRPVDPHYAVRPTDQVGYADGYPFLLASEESLADLNARLPAPLPMDRFRPNLILSGSGIAYGEDLLRRFALGPITFEVVKPCARCAIPTVDQRTAATGKEPLRTLATYRKVGTKVLFGQNAVHEGAGTLRVGEAVRVLALKGEG